MRCRSGILLAAGLCLQSQAAVFHVSQLHPQADDQGPGTLERPWKTVSHAVTSIQAGDTIQVHSGIYREEVVVEKGGEPGHEVSIEAAPGEQVVITGADELKNWQRHEESRPVYKTVWPHRFIAWSPQMTHPGDEYHRVIGRCEQVIVNGYFLRQVLESEQMAPGTFFVDTAGKSLLVWDYGNRDLGKGVVEASVRPELLRVNAPHVSVRGLHFRYAANRAQHGAVILAGAHGRLEDCVLERMNSIGATFLAPDLLVSGCVFRDNGQLGFGASRAHRLRFTGCVVENNNTKGFDRGWEAGGNKLVLCRDAVLEQSRFVRNRGQGVWFDIGNENCTVRNCLIADNEDGGIFYEISFGLQARDNVITRNGFARTSGAWGAQAGIVLSSSPHCVVERNLILGNREGFNFREQYRSTPRIDERQEIPIWNQDQVIRNNLLVLNRDAQVWGWFDVPDARHWPAKHPHAQSSKKQGTPAEDLAARYQDQSTHLPANLKLESLRFRFEKNIYFAAPGQTWFAWGTPWRTHQKFASLREFQSVLGIDQDSRALRPEFLNPAADDYRLSPAQMKEFKHAYPQGNVPGARLGTSEPH